MAKLCAWFGRTHVNYSGTLGSALDRHPLLSFGMPVGVIAVPIPTIKMVDGAAFTPQGANRGVVVGDSPIGISMFMLNLSPSKWEWER